MHSQNKIDELRENLFGEFLKYADYKNAAEWNKAVRICECLAIIGWGSHEALEAIREIFYNGTGKLKVLYDNLFLKDFK